MQLPSLWMFRRKALPLGEIRPIAEVSATCEWISAPDRSLSEKRTLVSDRSHACRERWDSCYQLNSPLLSLARCHCGVGCAPAARWMAGVNYLVRPASTILAGGGGGIS
jgi:hypothetical protein